MRTKTDWSQALLPLLRKYGRRKHPLDYQNLYQLIVAVVLSARATDNYINQITPAFFEAFPAFDVLKNADEETLYRYIKGIPGYRHKAKWLLAIAKKVSAEKEFALTIGALTALPGIGRKSANVIMREAGAKPEGVIVDLHVMRVAPRLGIAKGNDPVKIEQQLMKKLPRQYWDAGMAISFLGREICRPTNPKCEECPVNAACAYYRRRRKK
jgi:endonuclease-3